VALIIRRTGSLREHRKEYYAHYSDDRQSDNCAYLTFVLLLGVQFGLGVFALDYVPGFVRRQAQRRCFSQQQALLVRVQAPLSQVLPDDILELHRRVNDFRRRRMRFGLRFENDFFGLFGLRLVRRDNPQTIGKQAIVFRAACGVYQIDPGAGDLVHHLLDSVARFAVRVQRELVELSKLLTGGLFDSVQIVAEQFEPKERVIIRRSVTGGNAKPFCIKVRRHENAYALLPAKRTPNRSIRLKPKNNRQACDPQEGPSRRRLKSF